MGTQAFRFRFHRCTHRYCYLLQPHFHLFSRLWCFLRPAHCVAPHFSQGLHKVPDNHETWSCRRLSSRLRVVVMGASQLCAISTPWPRYQILTLVFSGCKFNGPSRPSHSVCPPRFRFDQLPGPVRTEHRRRRSCREPVGRGKR